MTIEKVAARGVELSFSGKLHLLNPHPWSAKKAWNRATLTMWECPNCAALVLPDMIAKHIDWHGEELVGVGLRSDG